MCRDERTDNRKDPAPETRHAGRGASDGRGKGLGRPAVEDGVEHGLEEVFHGVEADVGRFGVDRGEEEEGGGHEGRGDDHGPLAADERDGVHEGAEEDARDAADVDDDVVAVRFLHRDVDGGVFAEEDGGKVGAWKGVLVVWVWVGWWLGEGCVPATLKPQ